MLMRIIFIRVDDSLTEFAGLDSLCEEHIKLLICSVFGLGQTEVRPDSDTSSCPSPEESCLALPVPFDGVQLLKLVSLCPLIFKC